MKCPHCKPISTPETENRKTSHKYGTFTRQSDGRRISRYKCLLCKKTYSSATDDLAYYQKKRRVNYQLKNLLASNVSLRRAAKILNISRTTVARKLAFLGMTSRLENKAFLNHYSDTITGPVGIFETGPDVFNAHDMKALDSIGQDGNRRVFERLREKGLVYTPQLGFWGLTKRGLARAQAIKKEYQGES